MPVCCIYYCIVHGLNSLAYSSNVHACHSVVYIECYIADWLCLCCVSFLRTTVNVEILAEHLIWWFGDWAQNRQIKNRQYFGVHAQLTSLRQDMQPPQIKNSPIFYFGGFWRNRQIFCMPIFLHLQYVPSSHAGLYLLVNVTQHIPASIIK